MILRSDITINGKEYKAGDEISSWLIYPFFLFHMLIFGGSGFFMAYSPDGAPVFFLYMHGGFAILVYLVFYLSLFGREAVKWMFINAALGIFGLYTEINWLLSFFGTTLADYAWYVHVIPFLYYVLYTFLLRQAVIDFSGSRHDREKRRAADRYYIIISVTIYLVFYFL